ncbi:putative phage Integrase [Magnetospirillum sp. XM-1]|uniref:tyrosine-type recombinase/integrase n=1 Tax=Magnetospirillum sp. XM-1 TaxID=1663591 RepID=UPI00073DEB47|nr:tyrosine-type recombinase/integrase [Magnetospirillum sp. XM-1]CUW41672.1 putative phage Integrase [Magnetospirillum sp. XM-1]
MMETTDMGRIDLPYLHAYRDRHGRMRHYYRRDGRRHPIKGEPGSAEFLAEYQRLHEAAEVKPTPKPGADTFGALVETYYVSPEFSHNLRTSTKAEYRRHIEPMRERWRNVPLIGITKKVVRSYRDSLAAQPVKANSALRVLKTLLAFAVDTELLAANPASKIKPLKVDSDGWLPWPEAALEKFSNKSRGAARIAFFLALETGQRRADVLSMRWDALTSDGGIMVKQAKTGAELWLPISPVLRVELERTRKEQAARVVERTKRKLQAATPLTIVARENGQPYTEDGFGTIWNREQHRVECPRLPFHGLRKNATIRLVENGHNPQQVAAITGHKTLEMIAHYGRRADQKRLAKATAQATDGRNGSDQ